MKKVLFIGIGNEKSSNKMVAALVKSEIDYVWTKWSDISFVGSKLHMNSLPIEWDEIGAVFFDTPRFSISKKISSDTKQEIEFNMGNELHALLTIIKEKNIFAPNMEFLLKYPFYNKFSQAYIFDTCGVSSIPTVHLNDNKLQKVSNLLAMEKINFPIVAKESYGESGAKVWKIKNLKDLNEFLNERRNINVIFQPFIENEADYRAIVVDGKCMGIMKRSAKNGEWKNNFSLGGNIEKYKDSKMEDFAIDACRKMNLDFVGLDIFALPKGYLVIEANLFFGLDGFESVYDQASVAETIVKMISKNLV